ncbi:hypothetical protein [uncultured Pseudomonas sp.]|uniref:hypothetical protein n=1 Tax=uncultured Pseudomonas sp. TaxID=114707 RepID=UPI0025DFD8A6|nr:hypothetical protein [uncultured Pseudomonas sp.]
MTLIQFIEENFLLTESNKKHLKKITTQIPDSFNFKNDYIVSKTSEIFFKEISIQKEISENSNNKMIGYEETAENLKMEDPKTPILMRFLDSKKWDGKVFYLEKKYYLGAILGKKKHPDWKTPPNWDGSLEMLEKFNKKPS